ncbi:MAG: hypothetical protein H6618_01430 [Deltaproteobacteria bacterium]|nr:hypothetical protein [Deltaproteobacteria bacterium]
MIICLAGVSSLLTSCISGQQESLQGDEVVEGDQEAGGEGDENAAFDQEDSSQGGSQGDYAQGDEEDGSSENLDEILNLSQQTDPGNSDGMSDQAPFDEASQNTQAPLWPEAASAPAAGSSLPVSAVPSAPSDNSNRVVRFVRTDGVQVLSSMDSGASVVTTLAQGDALVVAVTGEWAEIMAGRYVRLSDLSESMVRRVRGVQEWQSPAGSPGIARTP